MKIFYNFLIIDVLNCEFFKNGFYYQYLMLINSLKIRKKFAKDLESMYDNDVRKISKIKIK